MVREQPASVAITLPKGYTDWTEAVLRLKQSSLIVARDIAEQIEEQLPNPSVEPANTGAIVLHMGHFLWVKRVDGKWQSLDVAADAVDWKNLGHAELVFEGVRK